MAFLEIRLDSKHPEFAEELLSANGALSVSFVDAGDDPVLEPGPGETPLWPRTIAIGLFPDETDPARVEHSLREFLPDGESIKIERGLVEDQDWVRVWLKNCEPLKFGDRLWVCPEQKRVDEPGCQTLILDPGLAFGTGTHPSTGLCLEFIASSDCKALDVLDFGCGSGILGIASLLLGAASCTATDIDPQAIQATRDNARVNGVADRMHTLEHDQSLSPKPFDLVLANILARPLIELAPLLCACLKPGGQLVLAGLLDRQADEVRQAFSEKIEFGPDQSMDGWSRLTGRLTEADCP